MGKNRSMPEDIFYIIQHEQHDYATAYKMKIEGDGKLASIMRVYNVNKGVCNCPGSKQGTCKHELMVRSREQFREFQGFEIEQYKAWASANLDPIFQGLRFKYARMSKYKEDRFDALVYEANRAMLRPIDQERKALVIFFDQASVGVPYLKIVILLPEFKTSPLDSASDKEHATLIDEIRLAVVESCPVYKAIVDVLIRRGIKLDTKK